MRQPLIDINVLIDVLAEREPHQASAALVWTAAETGRIRALFPADSFSTVHYLLRHVSNDRTARRGVSLIHSVFEVIEIDGKLIRQALDSPITDFEDAVRYHSAVRAGADCIVTRDLRHFRKSGLPVLTPDDFIAALDAN